MTLAARTAGRGDFTVGVKFGYDAKNDHYGFVTRTVARFSSAGRMAHDHLVSPPPIPPEIIRHAVWLYVRFTLSNRDVEDLLAERGLDVSYETVRRWVLKFGPLFAQELRRRRPRPTSRWNLDEMAVMIVGRQFWLWRAVDDEGEVLDLLVQPRRDKAAAVKLMRKLLKKQGFAPDVLVTDKLRSYGAAKAELGLSARHEQGLRKNNRAEFASTDTTAGTENATLQIARISPALPVDLRRCPKHFQRPTPSHLPLRAPRPPRRSVPDVASCDSSMSPAGTSGPRVANSGSCDSARLCD